MITTLKVSAGFGDDLQVCLLRIQSLDSLVIFDAIEVEVTGVGAALYDRLTELELRAPVRSYRRELATTVGLLKK
jgi:hypothetical protein